MILLDDRAVQGFITDGYVMVKPDLPAQFHREVCKQTAGVLKEGNPGNDLLPKVELLDQVVFDPAVVGALNSVLGPGYVLHRHRHCHDLGPGSQGQDWHKDYPAEGNVRCHRCRWALAFYYPQDVTLEMGPTGVQPGTQYYMEPVAQHPGLPLCVEAGTVVIAHYEIWHRAMANSSDKMRIMNKLLFVRCQEPQAPAWNHSEEQWQPEGEHQTLRRHMWGWNRGSAPVLAPIDQDQVEEGIRALASEAVETRRRAADVLAGAGLASQSVLQALETALADTDEGVRLNGVYALGCLGPAGVEVLARALKREAAGRWQANLDRGDFANPSQIDSIYGLAAAGLEALPVLRRLLGSQYWWERAAAAAALGCMGWDARGGLEGLVRALTDENEWVRRNAADALGNIAAPDQVAAAALGAALADRRVVTAWSLSDDPLRENAVAALARMGQTPKEVVPTLVELAQEGNQYLKDWAEVALERCA